MSKGKTGTTSHVRTYDEKFIGRFLVFLGHGVWFRLGETSDGGKEGKAGSEADSDTPSNASVSAGRVNSSGTVRTEGNPVS